MDFEHILCLKHSADPKWFLASPDREWLLPHMVCAACSEAKFSSFVVFRPGASKSSRSAPLCINKSNFMAARVASAVPALAQAGWVRIMKDNISRCSAQRPNFSPEVKFVFSRVKIFLSHFVLAGARGSFNLRRFPLLSAHRRRTEKTAISHDLTWKSTREVIFSSISVTRSSQSPHWRGVHGVKFISNCR